jgi:hypothetical protein
MITTFPFGYWGWGTNVNHLVDMIDESEAEAGFNPPVWVDIRHSRDVRATGFRGDALKLLVGDARYVWMQELGNSAIDTDRPAEVKLNNPNAVSKLLALAVDKANEGRRLLFFCACHFPYFAPIDCHRAVVAELLIREARRAKVSLEVKEWPGGNPEHLHAEIEEGLFRGIVKGRNFLSHNSLKPRLPKVLPYCSLLELCTKTEAHSLLVLTGPAGYHKGWVLPMFALWSTEDRGVSVEDVLAVARDYRSTLGFDALRTDTDRDPARISG